MSFPDLYFYSVIAVPKINGRNITLHAACTLQYRMYSFYTMQKPLTILTSYVIPVIVIIMSYARLLYFLRNRENKMVSCVIPYE